MQTASNRQPARDVSLPSALKKSIIIRQPNEVVNILTFPADHGTGHIPQGISNCYVERRSMGDLQDDSRAEKFLLKPGVIFLGGQYQL